MLAELQHGPALERRAERRDPPITDLPPMPLPEQRLLRVNLNLVPHAARRSTGASIQILGGPDLASR